MSAKACEVDRTNVFMDVTYGSDDDTEAFHSWDDNYPRRTIGYQSTFNIEIGQIGCRRCPIKSPYRCFSCVPGHSHRSLHVTPPPDDAISS
jgi:hypothetical protein